MSEIGAASLIRALGESEFPALLLAEGMRLIDAPHLSVVRFDDLLDPVVHMSISADGSDAATRAAALYSQAMLFRHDPLRSISGRISDQPPYVTRTRATDITDLEHRRLIYDGFGLIERYSLLGPDRGSWLALNFYRGVASRPVSSVSLDWLFTATPLLFALAAKHVGMVAARPVTSTEQNFAQRLTALLPALTQREIAVCARALCGLTNAEIAADLGIKVSTVSTFRRRAYDRLEVASLAELFHKCLSAAPDPPRS